MRKKTIIEDHLQMVDDCENRESRLNNWDTGFLDSIRNRLESNIFLTPTQEEKLEEIWEKCTREG